jgi:hypothetical protein
LLLWYYDETAPVTKLMFEIEAWSAYCMVLYQA